MSVRLHAFLLFTISTLGVTTRAELRLPAIIGDHMVLQQGQSNPIWGWDAPGTAVRVEFAGQMHSTTAGDEGKWTILLNPMFANASPQTLTVTGSTQRVVEDVLVGEVWMCAGQSNMALRLKSVRNGDLEAAASNLPGLRLISVPNLGTQELQHDFKGEWKAATSTVASEFSAVAFLYGRYLHQVLGVPVGLIENAWGASSAEAWVRRESLERDSRFAGLMRNVRKQEAEMQSEEAQLDYTHAMANWTEASALAVSLGKSPPSRPVSPQSWLSGNRRPGNIFCGVLYPTLSFGLRGVIWYQGESNIVRAAEYRELFPFLIEQWRKEWGQGNFPFYWVQLADYGDEKSVPGDSGWAELREAQTAALKLPNTGQAVIIDLGEGNNIHPRNKHNVAARLVRLALARDYGLSLPYRSPEFEHLEISSSKVLVTFDCFGADLQTLDVQEVRGFALCGADRVWQWASGKIVGKDQVEVWSDKVAAPIAVRYAWADNPVCNLFSSDGLAVTPFRTDDFAPTTQPPAAPVPPAGGKSTTLLGSRRSSRPSIGSTNH